MSRRLPYYQHSLEPRVLKEIGGGKLPLFEEEDMQRPNSALLKKVCDECWHLNPEERITMPEVLRMLRPDEYAGYQLPRANSHTGRGQFLGLCNSIRDTEMDLFVRVPIPTCKARTYLQVLRRKVRVSRTHPAFRTGLKLTQCRTQRSFYHGWGSHRSSMRSLRPFV